MEFEEVDGIEYDETDDQYATIPLVNYIYGYILMTLLLLSVRCTFHSQAIIPLAFCEEQTTPTTQTSIPNLY